MATFDFISWLIDQTSHKPLTTLIIPLPCPRVGAKHKRSRKIIPGDTGTQSRMQNLAVRSAASFFPTSTTPASQSSDTRNLYLKDTSTPSWEAGPNR